MENWSARICQARRALFQKTPLAMGLLLEVGEQTKLERINWGRRVRKEEERKMLKMICLNLDWRFNQSYSIIHAIYGICQPRSWGLVSNFSLANRERVRLLHSLPSVIYTAPSKKSTLSAYQVVTENVPVFPSAIEKKNKSMYDKAFPALLLLLSRCSL